MVGVVSVAGVGLWGRVWCVPFGYDGRVFGRKKEKAEAEAAQPQVVEEPQAPVDPKFTPKKGRPTPSRKEREAARHRPLVGGGDHALANDREARAELRRREREDNAKLRARQNEALRGGDQRFLPLVDQGPQRRYIRDYVDARRNLGDFMLIVLLVLLVGGWIGQGVSGSSEVGVSIYYGSVYAMYAAMLLWVIDYFILWRGLKKKLIAKFGEVQRGGGMYTFNRVMMVRRWRRPVPMVKYGEYPR